MTDRSFMFLLTSSRSCGNTEALAPRSTSAVGSCNYGTSARATAPATPSSTYPTLASRGPATCCDDTGPLQAPFPRRGDLRTAGRRTAAGRCHGPILRGQPGSRDRSRRPDAMTGVAERAVDLVAADRLLAYADRVLAAR